MTILAMPTSIKGIGRGSSFGIRWNVQIFISPLSGDAQTLELPGARFVASYALPPCGDDEAGPWKAFFAALRGPAGRFYGIDPLYTRRGAAGGTPVVEGAAQTGAALDTSGWPNSTLVLKKGDEIAYDTNSGARRQMHIVTADVTSDGAGLATIPVEAPIRVSPADQAALIVDSPSCVMMMTSPEIRWSDIDGLLYHGFSFDAVEVWP